MVYQMILANFSLPYRSIKLTLVLSKFTLLYCYIVSNGGSFYCSENVKFGGFSNVYHV